MARNLIRLGSVFARRLLTALGAAGLVSTSAAGSPMPSAERLALETRVQEVRQTLHDINSQAVPPDDIRLIAAQWGNWGNWANAWNNWGNWANWSNWGNWGNWANSG
jgi:hypothetical protein